MKPLIRFGMAVLLGLSTVSLFAGCDRRESDMRSAPSPSNSGGLSKEERAALLLLAERGDASAMYKLAIDCLFFEQDDEQGWIWMERSAEAGNGDARAAVLDYYADQESTEKKEHGESLRRKWKM